MKDSSTAKNKSHVALLKVFVKGHLSQVNIKNCLLRFQLHPIQNLPNKDVVQRKDAPIQS